MGPPGHHLAMVGPFSPGGDHPGGMGGPPHMERTSSGPRPPGPGRVLTFVDLFVGFARFARRSPPHMERTSGPRAPGSGRVLCCQIFGGCLEGVACSLLVANAVHWSSIMCDARASA